MPIRKVKAKLRAWREAVNVWGRTSVYRTALQSLAPAPALTDEPERAPWVVTIQYDAPAYNRVRWHCAVGALVAPNRILTSAHPFSQAAQAAGTIPVADKTFRVRLGGSGLDDGTLHEVVEVIPHPGYDPHTAAHDVAIVVIAPGTDAPPLCLDPRPVQVDDSVIVLGWPDGRDGDGQLTRARTTVIDPRIGGVGVTLCLANLADPDALRGGYSGAPVVSLRDGVPRACGVLSAGAQRVHVDGYGDPGRAVAVAAETDFITSVLRGTRVR